jgi:MerR HTH family regulatory protein/B12 binding domain
MEARTGRPLLRIGELSRRVGVSDRLLRAWESRYGLLQPVRSPGGFRLYSEADEPRIRQMQAYLADGLSAAEAAGAALGGGAVPGGRAGTPAAVPAGGELSAALRKALDALDEPAAQAVLDRLLADLSIPAVLRDVVLPYLADLGRRWQGGTASIATEHFASNGPARDTHPCRLRCAADLHAGPVTGSFYIPTQNLPSPCSTGWVSWCLPVRPGRMPAGGEWASRVRVWVACSRAGPWGRGPAALAAGWRSGPGWPS